RFAGTGSYLPERVVTNDDLSKTLDTNDEWIRTRTGISERRYAAPNEAASDMAIVASRRALEAAQVAPNEIDLIICTTMTMDYIIPTSAALIQRALGAENAGGFDLSSACSGFVLSSAVASNYIKTGAAKNVLVVGSEKMSGVMDPLD